MKKSITGLLCLLLCACYGCIVNDKTPKKANSEPTETIETRDESTGEFLRIHKFDDDQEYETRIYFRNQSVGVATRDPDTGVVLEYELTRPASRKILKHSKFSPDGKRLVWQETYDLTGKLQTRRQELPNGDNQESRYSENAEQLLIVHPNGGGEFKQWLLSPGQKGVSYLWIHLSWQKDGSCHSKFYAIPGNEGQLLYTHDKEDDGPLVESRYATGGQVVSRSYWKPVTSDELKDMGMAYDGEWLLEKVEELPFGSDRQSRTFIFDATPFQTRADKVEITDEDNNKTVIYKESGAEAKAADKVEVYDKDGKLIDKPAPKADYADKLTPKDPRSMEQPIAITTEWIKARIKERNNHFKPDSLISSLSKSRKN